MANDDREVRGLEIGRALRELRSRRENAKDEFRAAFGTASLAKVAEKEFGYGRQYIYDLIYHAEICDAVAEIECGFPNERQSRTLKPLLGLVNRLRATWQYAAEMELSSDDLKRVVAEVDRSGVADEAVREVADRTLAFDPPRRGAATRRNAVATSFAGVYRVEPAELAAIVRESGDYDAIKAWLEAVLAALTDQSLAVAA